MTSLPEVTLGERKSGWNNLLVGVDLNGNGVYTDSGKAIAYDNIGNPKITHRQIKCGQHKGTMNNYDFLVSDSD